MSATATLNRDILEDIFTEIKTLRREVSLFLPAENLSEYENAAVIRAAYRKASKIYPPNGNSQN